MITFSNILQKLETELKLRGFSPNTLTAYINSNKFFLGWIKKDAENVQEDDIKDYLAHLISDKNLSPASISLNKAALKFLFDEILQKNIVNMKTPKIPKHIPVVLIKEEIKKLIDSAGSYKSRVMIQFLYSSGLRLSELVKLKLKDLEITEKIGWVRKGKGNKDRLFLLSDTIIKELEKYTLTLDPDEKYLFPGWKGHISPRNVQKVVDNAARRACLTKKVHPHMLRHCFATHLLESGVDIRKIQELLGHANLQTTQIYTSVSKEELKKVKNPLDNL
ncbi:MAG: tyrosine-type recombinase/integrase [Nanoarchaeota archaeon]|nr:tyrosine-type recombinase/integrase [Nanoarchaeota archaeon]MCG2718618.1 tyrosine-type recombinase/integrase [Nanoarchaeota archaeon]